MLPCDSRELLFVTHSPHGPRPLLHCPEVLRCEYDEDVVHSQLFRQVFARCVRSFVRQVRRRQKRWLLPLIDSCDLMIALNLPHTTPDYKPSRVILDHSSIQFNFWCQWLRIDHIWWCSFNWCVVKAFNFKRQKCDVTPLWSLPQMWP